MCISWIIFNRIHFFAICDVFCLQCIRFYMIYLYMIISKVDEAASTNFFFFHTQFIYHIANQLHQHSNISRTIASSQHHPRETRPLLSQPNLYKIFYIGMSYDEIVLYITRNESIYFFIRFLFLSFLFLFYINSSQSICLFFFFPSFSYSIWTRVNLYAYSFSFLNFDILYKLESIYVLILFCFINIHIIYRIMSIYVPIRYIVIMDFCFLSIIFIFHIKSSRSIGLFDFSHSSSFFIFSSFSHYMKISVSLLSQIHPCLFLCFIFILYMNID